MLTRLLVPSLAIALLGAWSCSGSSFSGSSGSSSGGGASSSGSGGVDAGPQEPDAGNAQAPWQVESTTVPNLQAVWGGAVAPVSATESYLVGGVQGPLGPVATTVQHVQRVGDTVQVSVTTDALAPRFCGCAMVDPNAGELVVVGGRDASFQEDATGQVVNLQTGAVSPLDLGVAGTYLVGCHAAFLPDLNVGYVFGGVSEATGMFGSTLYRYVPADHSFVELPATGPAGRYDGVMRYPQAGGKVWLVAGMGLNALGNQPLFFSDVWQLDPLTETWSAVSATSAEVPPGRRFPWVAFAPQQQMLVMGLGSDSPRGSTLLADMWMFNAADGSWQAVAGVETAPGARGFASWLPGPAQSVGLLSGGLDVDGLVSQAMVFRSPFASDQWR